MGSRRKRGEEARESVRAAHSGTDLQGWRCFTTPQSAARRPLPIAPRPHQRSVVKDRPRLDSTRLESNRSAVVFEKLDSSPFLEKLTSSVRQYQGRGAVHGGGGAPTRASKHPVAPAWTVNLPVGRVRSVDTERRESF